MPGFLVPPTYVPIQPNETDMNLASIAFGVSIGVAIFSCAKALRHTHKSWKRGKRFTAYLALIWTQWTASTAMSAASWCYLRGIVEASFPLFFVIVLLWAVQIQSLIQILLNRISVLMVVRSKARMLKIGFFLALLLINISVFTIWIPARLQINSSWIQINNVWDRIEKGLFLLLDGGLNFYYCHLVRTRLISNGLTKYTRLFRFNLGMVIISMTMDVLLIAMMSLPNDIVYVQFHPLAYLVKLHIEMNMAELIAKVVKSSNDTSDYCTGTQPTSQRVASKHHQSMFGMSRNGNGNTTVVRAGTASDDFERPPTSRIQKTTEVEVKPMRPFEYEESSEWPSDDGSTRRLKREAFSAC